MDNSNRLSTYTIGDLLDFLEVVEIHLSRQGRLEDYDVFLEILRAYSYKEIDKATLDNEIALLIDDFPHLLQQLKLSTYLRNKNPEPIPEPPIPSFRCYHLTFSEAPVPSRSRSPSPDLVYPPSPSPSPSPSLEEPEPEDDIEPPGDNFFSFLHCISVVKNCFPNQPERVDRFLALLVRHDADIDSVTHDVDLQRDDDEWPQSGMSIATTSRPNIASSPTKAGIIRLKEDHYEGTVFNTLIFQSLSVLDAKEQLLALEDHLAISCMNQMTQALTDKSLADTKLDQKQCFALRRNLFDLSAHSEQLPSSSFVSGIICENRDSVAGGAFADIYRAKLGSTPVALKRLRVFRDQPSSQKMITRFCHEALVWQHLKHDHILPCLGIDRITFSPNYCMVAPWLSNGHIINYIKSRLRSNPDPNLLPLHRWILEILLGVEYLHSERIVHGDLRSPNILIDENLHVRISDFGFARLRDSLTPPSTGSSSHTNPRWLPTEVILGHSPVSFESDIYAFGCVWLEICTLRPPMWKLSEIQVVISKISGRPPQLWPSHDETDNIRLLLDPDTWAFIRGCWSEPSQRPTATTLIAKTRQITETY